MKQNRTAIRHLSDADVKGLSRAKSIDEFPLEYLRPSHHPYCEIRAAKTGGNGMFATSLIRAGEKVLCADGEKFDRPIVHSFQIDRDLHTMGMGGMNHRCDAPTCGIDAQSGDLVALCDIPAGHELTFNYLTTEWEMATPFECCCGSANCFGYIGGFSRLTARLRRDLLSRLPVAAYIEQLAGLD